MIILPDISENIALLFAKANEPLIPENLAPLDIGHPTFAKVIAQLDPTHFADLENTVEVPEDPALKISFEEGAAEEETTMPHTTALRSTSIKSSLSEIDELSEHGQYLNPMHQRDPLQQHQTNLVKDPHYETVKYDTKSAGIEFKQAQPTPLTHDAAPKQTQRTEQEVTPTIVLNSIQSRQETTVEIDEKPTLPINPAIPINKARIEPDFAPYKEQEVRPDKAQQANPVLLRAAIQIEGPGTPSTPKRQEVSFEPMTSTTLHAASEEQTPTKSEILPITANPEAKTPTAFWERRDRMNQTQEIPAPLVSKQASTKANPSKTLPDFGNAHDIRIHQGIKKFPSEISTPQHGLTAQGQLAANTSIASSVPPTAVHSNASFPASNLATLLDAAVTLRDSGGGQIDVALSPEDLGRLKIKLENVSSGPQITFFAERTDTQDMMRRQIEHLQQQFRQMGFENLSFAFEQHGSAQNQFPSTNDSDETDLIIVADEISEKTTPPPLTSGLDLRV